MFFLDRFCRVKNYKKGMKIYNTYYYTTWSKLEIYTSGPSSLKTTKGTWRLDSKFRTYKIIFIFYVNFVHTHFFTRVFGVRKIQKRYQNLQYLLLHNLVKTRNLCIGPFTSKKTKRYMAP